MQGFVAEVDLLVLMDFVNALMIIQYELDDAFFVMVLSKWHHFFLLVMVIWCFFLSYSVASPGSSCANGERCTGGSVCLDRMCTCPRGQIVMSDECVNAPQGIVHVQKRKATG